MARGNYAPRLTSCLHARAIVHDRVVGRPVIEPNGWPKDQKTVDDETVSGNCCVMGEATQERETTPNEIAAMQQQVREKMLTGALNFSVANFVGQSEGLFGVKVPSSVATDAERYALNSVLKKLNT